MSTNSSPGSTRGLWVVVGVLLAVGIVMPLLVNTYDSETPTLWGFPFYYWYQFLLIPIVSVLTFIAFKISETATDRDRAARGLRPHPHKGDVGPGDHDSTGGPQR
jgi:CBS domain containing-hemolysin-like protein